MSQPEEIDLNELEDFYNNIIEDEYFKHKQALLKLISKIDSYIIDLKQAEKKLIERKKEIDMDEKSEKYLDRFYQNIKQDIEALEVPERPTYENTNNLLSELQKLFQSMHESGRKNIRAFSENFKTELKEIDMITRKINEQMVKIDKFLRKKYTEVKEAESVTKKIPKLSSLVERISNSKTTVHNLQQKNKELKKELDELEEKIINIENHPLYKEKSKLEKDLVKMRMKFDEKLKFKKVLKKLKKILEKKSFKGISASDVKVYLSNPILTIVRDGHQHPRLTEFLVQLRYMIENDPNLQLKSEAKQKTLANINQIVNKGILKELIKEYNEKQEKLDEINKKLEKEQLSIQLNELKERISTKTQEYEHLSADLLHQQNEYRGLLEKLKAERDSLQEKIKYYTNRDVKVVIQFSY